ncbi:MAG: methyltransferase domain-containing protein [Actinomycetota bacterium]|nr:methyltransferase domain-containing protein [Actinomycetota bacterium]
MTIVLGTAEPCLRTRAGETLPLEVARWARPPGADEDALLDRALGPVLDVGCGPGRHVVALGRRGVMALGVDVTPAAVQMAHRRGALVLHRSVFDRLPGTGRWGSALLVDGNVGIGGDPVALLRRVAGLLRPAGRALVEVAEPGERSRKVQVRVESATGSGPWFQWAIVGADSVHHHASAAGLSTVERWEAGGRWFVRLDRR